MNGQKTHFHFVIYSCESIDLETGSCRNATTLDLIANTPEEAIEKAKKLAPNNIYKVHMVVEHFDKHCIGE